MAQLCVENEKDLMQFKDTLQSIARLERIQFIDGSQKTQRDYEILRENDPNFRFDTPVTHVSIEGRKGMGLTASNFLLHKYQIVVGFSKGNDPLQARVFANKVVRELKQHWTVEIVPPGQGAFPLKKCNDLVHSIDSGEDEALQPEPSE